MERLAIGYGDCSRSLSVVHEKLLGRDHQEQVQPRRADAERPHARHFQEQREEQVVLPSVSDEFSSWVEWIDQDFKTLLKLAAQMQEWYKDKIIAKLSKNVDWEPKRSPSFTNTSTSR